MVEGDARVAILGWGSIVWDPQNLAIANEQWESGGPQLPIEFARISGLRTVPRDPYLSLVIDVRGTHVADTLWNFSSLPDWKQARQNLAEREGLIRNIDRIGVAFSNRLADEHQLPPPLADRVHNWMQQHSVATLIWTDLRRNFKDTTGLHFTCDNVVALLNARVQNVSINLVRAKEYVRSAPPQVRTPMRACIETTLGWTPVPVSRGRCTDTGARERQARQRSV